MALYRQTITLKHGLPMSEIDPRTLQLYSEEHLLMNDVVQDDADLLFLDTYLTDIFKCRKECR